MRGLLRSKFPILLAAFVIAAVVALPMAIAVGSVQVTRAGALSFLSVGSLDCNGYSNIQKPLRPHDICTDLRGFNGERGEDNDHYIGHDEPSIQFNSKSWLVKFIIAALSSSSAPPYPQQLKIHL